MCFGKRGKYSGGKNRKYFLGSKKYWNFEPKMKNTDQKKIPMEKNKKERL